MIKTMAGTQVSERLLGNYLQSLVNCFFKILPIWESGEKSLTVYMQSLQAELLGCAELIDLLHDDAGVLSLAAILQYLIDNPDCPTPTVKHEVFKAINICNKLKEQYAKEA